MASTYSSLKIELIGTGDQAGTWGTTTNVNLGTAIEEAITGSADVPFSSADVTLTLTNSNGAQTARNLRLNLTGTSGGARNLIVPAIEKQYIINNGLADAVTVKNSTGTGIAVPAGKSAILFNTGANVVEALTYSSAVTYPGAGIPNSTGSAWGTSYTTSGSGTVVALATGASLTTPTINTAASVGGTWTSAAAWTIPGHSVTGDLTLSGAGYNFSGDFTNATIASRNAFKSSTTNGVTVVGAIPNGTATGSSFQVYNNSTPTNASLGSFEASSTLVTLASAIRGSGTYLPLTFNTNGSEVARFDTSGNFGIGTASPATKLDVQGSVYTGRSGTTGYTSVQPGTSTNAGIVAWYNTSDTRVGYVGYSTLAGSGTMELTSEISTNSLSFKTNSTERMRISAAGGVFVGSAGTDPGAGNLQVSGAVVSTRVNPRSLSLSSTSGAIIPASDTYDQVNYSLTGSSSFSNPSGTPVNGQKLSIRIYAASTQTISSWSSSTGGYRAIGTTLPTSAPAGKTIYVGAIWNSTDSFWDVVAVATQA